MSTRSLTLQSPSANARLFSCAANSKLSKSSQRVTPEFCDPALPRSVHTADSLGLAVKACRTSDQSKCSNLRAQTFSTDAGVTTRNDANNPYSDRHIKSRGIERSHSRQQTSFGPSQARKPPCS